MLSSLSTYGERHHGDPDAPLSLAMTRSARRGPWLPEEDQALLQLVRTQGANNWVRISQQIQHRSPKQCRERYHQNLKPSLKHDPISAQEGEVIERLVLEMGKRWAEIARRLGNRSDNAVKNWWNGSVNRRRRNPAQTSTGFKQVGSRLQPVPFTLPPTPAYHITSLPPLSLKAPMSPSRQNRLDTTKPFGIEVTRIPSPIHIHNSSATRLSPRLPFDSCVANQTTSDTKSTMNAFSSRPTLSRVVTSDLRPELPPLRSSSSFHLRKSERSHSAIDRAPISPALSDNSQRHAPSLISDTQSTYSISPRTITTPRPGTSAPIEAISTPWPDSQLTVCQSSQNASFKPSYFLSSYAKYNADSHFESVSYRGSVTVHEDRCKDTRMNVSTLLQ